MRWSGGGSVYRKMENHGSTEAGSFERREKVEKTTGRERERERVCVCVCV